MLYAKVDMLLVITFSKTLETKKKHFSFLIGMYVLYRLIE